jgi:beta-lactamase regulating signal transducer with metallopeptidase domain
MTATFTMQDIAQISAARIVDCLLEGTLIAVFAGLMLRTSRRPSSGTRFAVWFSTLMAIAALPMLGLVVLRNSASSGLAQNAIRPILTLPGSWAFYLFAVWGIIATWCLLRVGVGLWHLRSLRGTCVPLDPSQLNALLRETLERNRGSRRVALCTSERVQVPTAIGLVIPLVVIPQWILEELSPDELNQIVLHELAHLQRWDDWTNLAQQLVKAVFFFHPAVWWIEKKISLEREMACDDAVLAATARPRAYAECLARLAEKTLVRRSLALAQAALGRVRHTSLRVAQILDANCPRGTKHAWRPAIVMVAGFAIACGFVASRAPRAVAFEDSPSHVMPALASLGNPAVPVIPAALKTSGKHAPRTFRRMRPARLVQAKNVVQAKHKLPNGPILPAAGQTVESSFVIESLSLNPVLPRLASCRPNTQVSTQAVFVMVSHAGSGQRMYEIHVWRMTVFSPVVRSVGPQVFPRKT